MRSRGAHGSIRLGKTFALVPSLCLLAAIAASGPALAWGTKGHSWVSENAIRLLPEGELKTYLSAETGRVSYLSLIPDFQWKDGNIAKLEAPEHYIDLEVFAPTPKVGDIPVTREAAVRLYNEKGIAFSNGGFLPWRIEDLFAALVNAMKADPGNIVFYAGILSHYAADATQPLHTTVNFDGRTDNRANGRKELAGIHADYEITYLEDQGFEFRKSSLALAAKPEPIGDVHAATCAVLLDSFAKVDAIYDVARRNQGEDKYPAWDRELGAMTRGQLAKGATFVASLWLTAWQQAGSPQLKVTRSR